MSGSVEDAPRRERLTRPVYNIGVSTLLTVSILLTQPVVSPELSGGAVLAGAALGGVVAYATELFTGPLRWAVEIKDVGLIAGAVLIGVAVVLFLSVAQRAAVLHGGLAYLWAGSIVSVLLH
jgi:hypothetical protein